MKGYARRVTTAQSASVQDLKVRSERKECRDRRGPLELGNGKETLGVGWERGKRDP